MNTYKKNTKIDLISKLLLIVLMIASALITFTSCQEDNIVKTQIPKPQDKPEIYDNPDTMVHKPDSIIVPTDPIVNKPDPTTDPDKDKKTIKINWTDLDYKQYTFNDKNQLEKYHYQYVFVQNDPSKIKYFDYEYSYDESGRVIESTYNKNFKTIYQYVNGHLSGAKEYNGYNELSSEYSFTTDGSGRVTEQVVKSFVTGYSQMKYTYQYNSDGNLTQMKQYYFEGDRYILSLTFEWENFDNSAYIENYSSFSPYVPTFAYWKNNPGKRTVRDRNGNVTGAVEFYSYTYDGQEKVTTKSKQVVMDNKTYPPTTQYYTYKNFL